MLKINEERFLADMRAQAGIGATADGGVHRPALSAADLEIREWFQTRVEDDDILFRQDSAGNLSAILSCAKPDAKTLLVGSHLDSVPNGGRYDGVLGVLSGLEVLRTIRDANVSLPFHLEIISFTDEEGTLVGCLGSSAIAGTMDKDTLQNPRGGRDRLLAGMKEIELTDDGFLAAKRNPEGLLGYLELHIEQGSRLEKAEIDIGVVTSIVGIRSFWLTFIGVAAHAGTMPMQDRQDALWGASSFIQEARQLVMDEYDPGVINFGRLCIEPDAFNIVPREVRLAMEFRNGSEDLLDEMESHLLKLADSSAHKYQLGLEISPSGRIISQPMNRNFIQAIEDSAEHLGLSHTRLMSFAGHDAQEINKITPAAMVFVPSVNGVSHSPKEFTRDQDCINGANAILQTVMDIANW